MTTNPHAPLDLSTRSRGLLEGQTQNQTHSDPPCAPGPPLSCARKRCADPSFLKLPLRKRPVIYEREEEKEEEKEEEEEEEEEVWLSPVNLLHSPDSSTINYGHHQILYVPPEPEPEPEPEPNHWYQTSLFLATRQDDDGDTALHIAVVQGEFSIIHRLIHLLMKARRSLDIYNNLRQTPLHLAVITNQRDMMEALLRGGADPSALDRNGHTCLHLCSEYDHIECLSVLLRSSFTPLEITNYEGRTALHVAVLQRHVHVVQMLLKAGANINATDIKSGQSPLMLAVETNNTPMVHFLLQSGCEVNSRSYGGNTALHGACGRGQVDTVHLLLKNGADISLKNSHNDTPLMVAANKKVADVLRGKRVKHHDVVTEHKDGSSSPGLRHRAFYSPQSVSYHTCGNIDYLHPTKHQICERRT